MPWPKLIAYNAKPTKRISEISIEKWKRQRISIFNITKKEKENEKETE